MLRILFTLFLAAILLLTASVAIISIWDIVPISWLMIGQITISVILACIASTLLVLIFLPYGQKTTYIKGCIAHKKA
ncbi:hypothetical protein AwWohl_13890 [Gammaproteobacteria bacterium]|nr:hypothetical protein AwWohl_13890 [Gammaproteobacteria bacterium]